MGTARCGPACRVVWGERVQSPLLPDSALEWYAEEVGSLALAMGSKNYAAIEAIVTVLALDGGRRAVEALEQNVKGHRTGVSPFDVPPCSAFRSFRFWLFRQFVIECVVVNWRRIIVGAEPNENLIGYNGCCIVKVLSLDEPRIE